MIWIIAKKEFLENVLSFRFIISFVLCFILIMVSSWTLVQDYGEELQNYRKSVVMHQRAVKNYTSGFYLGFSGIEVDKRPTVLSVIARGMEDFAGKVLRISTFFTPTLRGNLAEEDPMISIFGALDLNFIIRIVVSLLAILFTYDAVSGERERGTLRLIMANAVPRYSIILGKVLGGYLSLLMPFVVSLIGGFIAMNFSPVFRLVGEDWIRVLLIVLLSFLYIFVFFNLGLFVSSRTKNSATSLLALLLIWAIFVLAVPKISMVIADQVSPLPSSQEVRTEEQMIEQEEIFAFLLWNEMGGSGMSFSERQNEMFANITERKRKVEESYEKKWFKQLQLARNISRISPSSSYAYSLAALSRTGLNHQQHFLNVARNYQREFMKFCFDTMEKDQSTLYSAYDTSLIDPNKRIDVSGLPEFNYKDEGLSDSLREVWLDIILLSAFGVLFFMSAYISFLRYDLI